MNDWVVYDQFLESLDIVRGDKKFIKIGIQAMIDLDVRIFHGTHQVGRWIVICKL